MRSCTSWNISVVSKIGYCAASELRPSLDLVRESYIWVHSGTCTASLGTKQLVSIWLLLISSITGILQDMDICSSIFVLWIPSKPEVGILSSSDDI